MRSFLLRSILILTASQKIEFVRAEYFGKCFNVADHDLLIEKVDGDVIKKCVQNVKIKF